MQSWTPLEAAAARLQAEDLSPLIPEVMSNLGYAAPYPEGPQDVAAFPGRLVKSPQGLLIPAPPAFGASRHLAAIILTAMATHPELRSAMNISYVEGIEDLAPLLHLRVASFDRAPGTGGSEGQGRRHPGLGRGLGAASPASRPRTSSTIRATWARKP